MEIKYTTDGKKVVVIGNLNAQDKIVQEIFIVNDAEIPSGENFVVSSLHDAPAISWKEKKAKEVEIQYEKATKEFDKKQDELRGKLRNQQELLQARLYSTIQMNKNVNPDSFSLLIDVICGNIKWVVKGGYSPVIIPYEEDSEEFAYEKGKLRLLSIFGKDDGSLTYSLGQYSDYSGGSTEIFPFKTYEEALGKVTQIINDTEKYHDRTIEAAKKHNIPLDKFKLQAYKDEKAKNILSSIESYRKTIATYEAQLDELNNS